MKVLFVLSKRNILLHIFQKANIFFFQKLFFIFVGAISIHLFFFFLLKNSFAVLTVAVCLAFPYIRREETVNNCDIACPYFYFPVCGTDGQNYKVFSNDCFMGRQSCLERRG